MPCHQPSTLLRLYPITILPAANQPTAITCHDDLYQYLDPYLDPYQDPVPHKDIYRDAHSDNPSDLIVFPSDKPSYQAKTNSSFPPLRHSRCLYISNPPLSGRYD